METTSRAKPKRLRSLKRAFRKRWVWVVLVVLVWMLALVGTYYRFAPKPPNKGGGKGDTSRFKFLHCDQCMMELPYNKELDGKKCAKCSQPPKVGFLIPTEVSLKSSRGMMDPWMKVYVAFFTETVIMLGVLTYLMYRSVPDPNTQFYIVSCPYCNQRLRYRAVSHGGLGSCSRCKRVIRFPDEEDAMSEPDVLAADEAAARAEMERAMDMEAQPEGK